METPPKIVFEGMDADPGAKARIEDEIDKLEQYFGHITACRAVVKAPSRRRRQGDLYEVKVHLSLPDGREVNASRNPPSDHAHEELQVAIRDTFRAARRQLEDKARKLRGKVKHHDEAPLATVARIFPDQGYGFLETGEGSEVYFHRNAVLNDGFEKLEVGTRVSFAEEAGDKGPQASTVRLLGKHGMR